VVKAAIVMVCDLERLILDLFADLPMRTPLWRFGPSSLYLKFKINHNFISIQLTPKKGIIVIRLGHVSCAN